MQTITTIHCSTASSNGHRFRVEEVHCTFSNGTDKEKSLALSDLLHGAMHNHAILQHLLTAEVICTFFEKKCKALKIEEELSFIKASFLYLEAPCSEKAYQVVRLYIDPSSVHAVDFQRAPPTETLYEQIRRYAEEEEKLKQQIRSYLKNILLNLSIQFSSNAS